MVAGRNSLDNEDDDQDVETDEVDFGHRVGDPGKAISKD